MLGLCMFAENSVYSEHITVVGDEGKPGPLGASFVERRQFAAAIRNGAPSEVSLEERLRSVATGIAAHQSIASGRAVELADVSPAGW